MYYTEFYRKNGILMYRVNKDERSVSSLTGWSEEALKSCVIRDDGCGFSVSDKLAEEIMSSIDTQPETEKRKNGGEYVTAWYYIKKYPELSMHLWKFLHVHGIM